MTDSRLADLKTVSATLHQALKPEGTSPLSAQDITETIGEQVVEQLRIVGVEAQNGDPLEYGRTLAADLEGCARAANPLSGSVLNLLVQGLDNSLRYFDDDPSCGKTAPAGSHSDYLFTAVATGHLLLKGYICEACQLDSNDLTATISLLATQAEFTNRLLAVLEDSESFLQAAIEKHSLEEYAHLLEGNTLSVKEVVEKIRYKLHASKELSRSS